MAVAIDPEERETREVLAAADLQGARVLEIGCGTGRLTRRYAAYAGFTVGVDSSLEGVMTASSLRRMQRVAYAQANAPTLPFGNATFDAVLFGWSL